MADDCGPRADAFDDELSGGQQPGTLSESAILERFRAQLDEAIAGADDQGSAGAVVYVGLDGFRAVSSGLGREAGQAVLAALGQRLRHATRGGSVVAHLGGDQFAVLLPPASQLRTLRSAEQLRQIVAVPIRLGDRLIVRHASAGIAIVRPWPATAEGLICEAESAVALAKLRGGDQVAMFDPRAHTGLQEDARLEVDLSEALDRDELSLVFHPVVDLYDGRIIMLEALVRWNHPEHGAIAAGRLVALAEQTALRSHLGRWVLRAACAAAAGWQAAGADPPPVSVNVSPQELARPGFAQEALAIRTAAGLAHHAIMLEITGTSPLPLLKSLDSVIDDLHASGFRVLLDDFCSGAASLRHLEEFRVSGVKIDRSLTLRLGQDAYPRALISAILGLGRTLGLRVIVDGVETAEQAELLRGLGCREGQGWLFSRPLTADAVPEILRNRSPMPGTGEDQTMSLGAAVEALGVSASTVRRRIADGHLAASRTRGGHRRLRRSDVERERRRTHQGPVVRPPQDPGGKLPAIGAILLERGPWIRDVALRYVYVGDDHGWFGTPGGQSELDLWLAEVGDGLSSGCFEQVTAATTAVLDAARDAGVSLAERVSLLDATAQGARAALAGRGAPAGELRDWIRVGRVLRQLAFQDGPVAPAAARADTT
jgi:diguanylate cyclase (GGDEF)-like protein/excisionase family DNA binding protein